MVCPELSRLQKMLPLICSYSRYEYDQEHTVYRIVFKNDVTPFLSARGATPKNSGGDVEIYTLFQSCLRACLQGGRVTLESGLTLAAGQKIARVYKQNFTGR